MMKRNVPLDKNEPHPKGGLSALARFCKPYFPAIAVALVCAVGGTIFTIIGPDKLSELTDVISAGLMGGIDMAAVTRIAATLAVMYGLSFLLSVLQGQLMTGVTQKASRQLREAISRKVNRLPIDYYNKTTFGDILSRVTNDVDLIGQTIQSSIITFVSAVVTLVGCLVMMFVTNWVMTLSAIAATLLGFLLITLITSRSQKYFVARQQELGEINGHIEEAYSGHTVLRVYNAERQFSETFESLNEKLYNASWKSQFLSGLMMPVMNFVGNLGYVTVCVVGALLALNGSITFGVIVAFMVYVRLFTSPLSQIAQALTSLQSASAAAGRVFEFLEAEEMEDESGKTKTLLNPTGQVTFSHVKFGYTPGRPIIKDFNLDVKPGQKVAIVGPTGAGKTTLVNLLMRFYELNGGSISMDGVNLHDITRENVHDLFGMVLQDTWLFEGTIRENLCYGKAGITDGQLDRACKAVGLLHFIRALPHGYDTVLDASVSLSEGQKQLLTIARAMIEDAPMLILDEATSSVDTRTEILIQKAMDELTRGRTSFVIAHRLSTIKNADIILVLRDGDVVESGSHEELLEKGGFYAELYNAQFSDAA
ncbi:MAG TPA: ABC transporter ATP-binding protein [Candidatus Faecivivens stercoravium]|uniref:ABC transporter ATP-binding protein n=1 Tax=Candidatus Faecivivens stercoravium TaxID=2840803 RepID=A0A9D1DXS4_9FIRM|nr:ABC transporter ATP-binding protein [Candidatus Faecivivens stercoravium]